MDVTIHQSWKPYLQSEFNKPYFEKLKVFVKQEYSTQKCFPPEKQIFAAFDWCSFDDLKVVIIGQDPYHGAGQANGLCFSVDDGKAHPPSLINIFKEIQTDLGIPYPTSGNLERWAKQGVLLLNATLSVRKDTPNSHKHLKWQQFTDAVIQKLATEKEHLVFLLWGAFAQKKVQFIDQTKHLILTSGHPSPMSANQGKWFGNKHFSQTNQYLEDNGKQKIEW